MPPPAPVLAAIAAPSQVAPTGLHLSDADVLSHPAMRGGHRIEDVWCKAWDGDSEDKR
jgi:hypothetical protein